MPGCGCGGCLFFVLIAFFLALIVGLFAYRDIRSTSDAIHEEVEDQEVMRDDAVDLGDGDPFSVLLMGIDTGEEGRVDQGRSDTMMVVTVNPHTQQSTIVSIPRDTYTEIAGRGTMDKINHAYAFGGTSMAVNTVQKLFDIPIDYYVSINMEGLEQIVDALDGITLVPDSTFQQSGYSFTQGQETQLDGGAALAYSRMRKQDPEGDYGRQKRQRQVVMAIVDELASIESILNYRSVLSVLDQNMATNMAFDEMVTIFTNYRDASGNTRQEQLSGEGTRIDGVYYDIVSDAEINRVQTLLKEDLEIN
ncbi:LCP family glycopolymer transferase [Alloiococcus otitis]|uniref:LCP family glycopolymer transferase n=1 Tax=Alloiococcus otitis TaxID=1652 RepID=UPI00058F9059